MNPITGQVTSPGEQYVPLSNPERWKLYWKQNYMSVGAYFGPLFIAAVLDQTSNTPSEWGSGIGGYGLRVASRLTGAMIQGSIQAPAAAILHEDVRYISSSRRGFRRRAEHAVIYSLLTYNDHGHPTLNVANLGAYYASTAISTTWIPDRYDVGEYTLTSGSEQIALTIPVNLLQEFWPDIIARVLHRGSPATATN